ncbi:hypothetical protein B296_00002706 [Ensete ventricosum]|uniref:Uncharacterized protein n=1 Tax=Ensete ventricosum TaxID=4639 RepID=A0A426ZT53_ENSVE|nr:hypothetical protein B296_00002706 [Ensete ventricosum]
MTTKHKSPTSGGSIHPRLSKVNGANKSIVGSEHNTLYHFWQWSRNISQTSEYKRTSNKSGISRKHMRNNEIYMCQHEASTVLT